MDCADRSNEILDASALGQHSTTRKDIEEMEKEEEELSRITDFDSRNSISFPDLNRDFAKVRRIQERFRRRIKRLEIRWIGKFEIGDEFDNLENFSTAAFSL